MPRKRRRIGDREGDRHVKAEGKGFKRRGGVTSSVETPVHWPSDVIYLDAHSLSSDKVPAHLRLELCTEPEASAPANPSRIRSQRWTTVKPITKKTACHPAYGSDLVHHPAVGQYGLFARRDIPPRTLLVPYLGLVHLAGDDAKDEDPESRYDAAIEASDGTRLGIDATAMGSEARFVNDYRGILVRPNLFFDEWSAPYPCDAMAGAEHSDARPPERIKGLALYTGANEVKAGTELCVSYGKGWWSARMQEPV